MKDILTAPDLIEAIVAVFDQRVEGSAKLVLPYTPCVLSACDPVGPRETTKGFRYENMRRADCPYNQSRGLIYGLGRPDASYLFPGLACDLFIAGLDKKSFEDPKELHHKIRGASMGFQRHSLLAFNAEGLPEFLGIPGIYPGLRQYNQDLADELCTMIVKERYGSDGYYPWLTKPLTERLLGILQAPDPRMKQFFAAQD